MAAPTEMLPNRYHMLLVLGAFLMLYAQFINKPIHIDDTNFLRLAEGARIHPLAPHSVTINWTGRTVPAFEVLSNPPGIAWLLAPVLSAPIWIRHLWIMIWLLPAAWGFNELARTYCPKHRSTALWLLFTSPIVALSAQSLLPDLPLLACSMVGLGGFSSGRRYPQVWAFIAGLAYLFRYSGCLVCVPLLIIGWERYRWQLLVKCWPSAVPALLLAVNDLFAYGHWHLLAMFQFQTDGQYKSFGTTLNNLLASVAMIGGAGLLPIPVWQRGTLLSVFLGGWIAANASAIVGQTPLQAFQSALFCSAGFAVLFLIVAKNSRHVMLSCWAALGVLLMTISRFAAARYWLPFLPAFILLGLRLPHQSRTLHFAVAAQLLLALALSIDDYEFAVAERQSAEWAASHLPPSQFAGHWGFQFYLEQQGWRPMEAGTAPDLYLAHSVVADPQRIEEFCLTPLQQWSPEDRWPGPRTHSHGARAVYHGASGGSYCPWSFSDEPYDMITLYRICPGSAPLP